MTQTNKSTAQLFIQTVRRRRRHTEYDQARRGPPGDRHLGACGASQPASSCFLPLVGCDQKPSEREPLYTLSKSQDFGKRKHANGIKVGTFDHHKVDKEVHTVTQNCVFSVWLPGESLMIHTYISRPSQTIMPAWLTFDLAVAPLGNCFLRMES